MDKYLLQKQMLLSWPGICIPETITNMLKQCRLGKFKIVMLKQILLELKIMVDILTRQKLALLWGQR